LYAWGTAAEKVREYTHRNGTVFWMLYGQFTHEYIHGGIHKYTNKQTHTEIEPYLWILYENAENKPRSGAFWFRNLNLTVF
jgi:hypothetical protein